MESSGPSVDPPTSENQPASNPDPGPAAEWQYPKPPTFNFHAKFQRRRAASADASQESEYEGNFFRSARWCADGSAVLTHGEDRTVRLYKTTNLANPSFLTPSLTYPSPSSLVTATWYPSASVCNPATYCFLTSWRDGPVRLVDGTEGRLRASYPLISHTEKFIAPSSLTFNPDASKLYAGHDSAIEVFDFSRSGEAGERLKLRGTRKSRDGQGGLISTIAFSPDTSSRLYAAGSYNGSVCFYSEDTGAERVGELVMGGTMKGQEREGGVTQLAFHPLNPNIMLSASRLSSYAISLYDIRSPNAGPFLRLAHPKPQTPIDATLIPPNVSPSPASASAYTHKASGPGKTKTQQRIGFDIDWTGKWAACGGMNGAVGVWDMSAEGMAKACEGEVGAETVWNEKVHDDVVGSVAFHPTEPLLLTTAGSRIWPDDENGEDVFSSSESESESEEFSSNTDTDTDTDSDSPDEQEISSKTDELSKERESTKRSGQGSVMRRTKIRPRARDARMMMIWFGDDFKDGKIDAGGRAESDAGR